MEENFSLDKALSDEKSILAISAKFNYEGLMADSLEMSDFGSCPGSTFIQFGYMGDPDNQNQAKKGGWKFHISLDDSIPGNVAKAWNVIKDILIEHKISQSKVITPETRFTHDKKHPTQCGKQITIYQFIDPEKNWDKIINQIEEALIKVDAIPGKIHEGTEKRVKNSSYITYRNDMSKTGKYISADKAKSYNDGKHKDILQEISVNSIILIVEKQAVTESSSTLNILGNLGVSSESAKMLLRQLEQNNGLSIEKEIEPKELPLVSDEKINESTVLENDEDAELGKAIKLSMQSKQ